MGNSGQLMCVTSHVVLSQCRTATGLFRIRSRKTNGFGSVPERILAVRMDPERDRNGDGTVLGRTVGGGAPTSFVGHEWALRCACSWRAVFGKSEDLKSSRSKSDPRKMGIGPNPEKTNLKRDLGKKILKFASWGSITGHRSVPSRTAS